MQIGIEGQVQTLQPQEFVYMLFRATEVTGLEDDIRAGMTVHMLLVVRQSAWIKGAIVTIAAAPTSLNKK